MKTKDLAKISNFGGFDGKQIKITLTDGTTRVGYGAGYEDKDDNDIADGLRFELSPNEDEQGDGEVIPYEKIASIEFVKENKND